MFFFYIQHTFTRKRGNGSVVPRLVMSSQYYMSIHIESYKQAYRRNNQIFQDFQKLKILQVHFCVQRLSQHFLAVVWVWRKLGRNAFFAIIRAKMDEIQKFLRELFRINGDIYDAKYEVHLNNIKWSGA